MSAPSPWLSRFVRGEVHPFLCAHRQAAQAAGGRWFADHEARVSALAEWEARRNECLLQRAALPENKRRGRRAAGRVWANTCIPLDQDRAIRLKAWVPVELAKYSGPLPDFPLPPPPSDRDLSPDE